MVEITNSMEDISDVAIRSGIKPLSVLSICTGYGGLELGLRTILHTRTIMYVEIELSVASLLVSLMEKGLLDPAPIWSDLKSVPYEIASGKVDIIAGGFPCTPFSFAGGRKQESDDRNLWPDVRRLIERVGFPKLVYFENVPGIITAGDGKPGYYWTTIRRELREMGYSVKEGIFSAQEVGAPHRRDRLYILGSLAHIQGEG